MPGGPAPGLQWGSVLDTNSISVLLGQAELALVLGLTRGTVRVYLHCHPDRLPPPLRLPDRHPCWLQEDVQAWLRAHRSAPETQPAVQARRGRPSTAERLAARELGLSVRELRLQRALGAA